MQEILAACGAWVWVFILRIHTFHKSIRRKPFSCEVCMAGWFTLILLVQDTYWLYIPFRMAVAMILTIILTRIMSKV